MDISYENSQLLILFEGYSYIQGGIMKANCTTTLIKGPPNIIVDTRTAWDAEELNEALRMRDVAANDINYVICTHGHSDHIGCNHLFKNAIHIVGYSISDRDKYFLEPDFSKGEEFTIGEHIKIIPTPGHTLQDVSVIFLTSSKEIVAITGDLFEKEQDLQDGQIWIDAGSDSTDLQRKNRRKILEMADYIVPGHGPMFKVPKVEFNSENHIIKCSKI